ncbi:hypothetical protein [Butyricicoccus porcorum]|uniref:hypothetical protein n=1 Tax=Butyricicoccus porcorum TaxID=1945634 RepID=UPI003F4A8A7A
MTNSNYPRLSGGTFFILVLQALRQRIKAREHYKGESDGLKDPNVLIGLIKVINPDYVAPAGDALKTKTNDFKSCKLSKGEYLPFGKTAEIEEFDNRIQNDYGSALSAMVGFVEQFLETGTAAKKDVRLVKALMELIQSDDSIGADEEFYISENGDKIKKAAFGDLTDICLPAFLLGVWHYVVVNRKDNKVGQDTYNKWCPPAGGGPREYKSNIGKAITRDISVYTVDISDSQEEEPQDDEPEVHAQEDTAQTPPPSPASVYNNNPLFIQQNGDGNVVMPNYGTINITFGKK